MSIFDGLSDDPSCGYRSIRNTEGWDNAAVLERLARVQTPFGTPKLGWIRAFGRERQVVVYDRADESSYLYVNAKPRKLVVSFAPKPGCLGGAFENVDPDELTEDPRQDLDTLDNAFSAGLDMMDNAGRVNVIVEVLRGLIDGVDPSQLTVEPPQPDTAAYFSMEDTDEIILSSHFNVFDADGEPAYYIEMDLMDTNFRIFDADGDEIMRIRRRFTVVPEYVLLEDGEETGFLRKKLKLTDTDLEGTIRGMDLVLDGDPVRLSFRILLNGEEVGSVSPSLTSGVGNFTIRVVDSGMTDAVVSLATVCVRFIREF